MGCLVELFFEIFVEGMIELVGYCYIKIMQLIVPDKAISKRVKKTIKTVAATFAAVLALVLIIGLVLWVQEDPSIKSIGKYMIYISLTIMVIQIALGIFVRIFSRLKK